MAIFMINWSTVCELLQNINFQFVTFVNRLPILGSGIYDQHYCFTLYNFRPAIRATTVTLTETSYRNPCIDCNSRIP